MVTANSDATFCCFCLKKKLSFPQFGARKTKFMKLKCISSDVYRSVLQIVSQCNIIFMGEQCILGNLGNNGCHCCYFFSISKKEYFLMFYNMQTLCDTVCIFSLHLTNFKGGIGVPVAVAPIFLSSSNFAEVLPVKFITMTSSLHHSQLQVHIYILLKVVIGNL